MIEVKIFGDTAPMVEAAGRLDALDGVAHVAVSPAVRPGLSIVRADARDDAVDQMLGSTY